jgi:prepilin-type processing-associated H-X9-DG protein
LSSLEGHNNYALCSGSSPDSVNVNGPYNGMFVGANPSAVLNTRVYRLADVIDGLSQTAMMSEKVKGTGGNTTAPIFDTLQPSSNVYYVTGTVSSPQAYYQTCKGFVPAGVASLATGLGFNSGPFGIGGAWHIGYPPQTRYTHVMTPNMLSCNNDNGGGPGCQGAHTASSRHSGGINLLFGDGTVRFLKNSVSTATWWALGTRANGEVVSSSDY